MTLSEFLNSNQRLFEDTDSGGVSSSGSKTTSSDVTFVPSQLGVIKPHLTNLSKKKTRWKTKIEQYPKFRRMKVEESLNIDIRNDHWELFKDNMFEGVDVGNEFELDLTYFLVEATNDEIAIAREDLKVQLVSLLNSPVIKGYRHKIAKLIEYSGDSHLNFTPIGNAILTEPSADRQLHQLIDQINKAYGNDLGAYQILSNAIQNKQPLNSLPLFKNNDNILGTQVNGEFLGHQFSYLNEVGLDFTLTETFKTQSKELEDRLKTAPFMKEENGVFYSTDPEGLPYNFVELLEKYIQGV